MEIDYRKSLVFTAAQHLIERGLLLKKHLYLKFGVALYAVHYSAERRFGKQYEQQTDAKLNSFKYFIIKSLFPYER